MQSLHRIRNSTLLNILASFCGKSNILHAELSFLSFECWCIFLDCLCYFSFMCGWNKTFILFCNTTCFTSSWAHYNYKINSQNLQDSLIRTTTLLSTMNDLLSMEKEHYCGLCKLGTSTRQIILYLWLSTPHSTRHPDINTPYLPLTLTATPNQRER